MAYKTYIVDGRQFRTEQDYKDAMHDQELIEKLRADSAGFDVLQLKKLLERVRKREFHFRTLLGQDFDDEISDRIRRMEREKGKSKTAGPERRRTVEKGKHTAVEPARAKPKTAEKGKSGTLERGERSSTKADTSPKRTTQRTASSFSGYTQEQEQALREAVRQELARQEKRRKILLMMSGVLAVAFLGIFGVYAYQESRTRAQNERLGELIGSQTGKTDMSSRPENPANTGVTVTLDGERVVPEVLEEYKSIYNQHKKLIGWLKFDDIDIGGKYGFPVMQTGDNEFFLSHDIEMKEDRNGTIFMDTNCDVLEPSDNFILYGHHMKSGAMFGNLDHYARQDYWKKYPYIEFDTIYEKGTYQVMYVFRSRVYSEAEIVFKYYQFIDAISEQEFDSYMEEMAELSLYDTGVTASFGDQLLTLSTCDYQETDGRFVVVAKKVPARE